MAKTIVAENETIEMAMKKFKNSVIHAGTLMAAKKHEFYLKPGAARRERIRASRAKRKK
jgi:small subunit ribosomal protein S21